MIELIDKEPYETLLPDQPSHGLPCEYASKKDKSYQAPLGVNNNLQQKNPNRLVRISDLGALTREIIAIKGEDLTCHLELSHAEQKAQRRRLPGAISTPEIDDNSGKLMIYWEGGDGLIYQASLVGISSQQSCAIVTEVTSKLRPLTPYQMRSYEHGPWF